MSEELQCPDDNSLNEGILHQLYSDAFHTEIVFEQNNNNNDSISAPKRPVIILTAESIQHRKTPFQAMCDPGSDFSYFKRSSVSKGTVPQKTFRPHVVTTLNGHNTL